MVLLPCVRVLLWTRGYRRTMRLLSSRVQQPRSADGSAGVPDPVAEIASAVTAVARLAPFLSRCLARSITIWWLCRRRGHDTDVLIGVAPPEDGRLPAHAWVEYRGVPLNDTADVRTRYGVIS
jgi:Transglutaminase-like superfamily